ncbi:hypothetical protein [Actinacidiphila sp. ITFR-21]|uniref:hypothetical protein n=1 Tax=Actinacidiphila sp. ITFR-21 TaxID=3075199 RepID=UPI0037D9E0DA
MGLPHGRGRDREGTRPTAAAREPGSDVNQPPDGSRFDPLSGTAVLNGFPVRGEAVTDGTTRPLATKN